MYLNIFAGITALKKIKEEGFKPDTFGTLLGASGAAKWLAISSLEKSVYPWLKNRKTKIECLGSSIGAWRSTCLAQNDPEAALSRLEKAYISQAYPKDWGPRHVDQEGERILQETLGAYGLKEIFNQDKVVLNIVSTKCEKIMRSDDSRFLATSISLTSLANMLSRKLLLSLLKRAVFSTHVVSSRIKFNDSATRHFKLTQENFHKVLMASGSIPLVSSKIQNIQGADEGVYRDGGLIDYHFDFSFQTDSRLILYPHFYSKITPGWFDKNLFWRKVKGSVLDNVVLLCPTQEFLNALPYKKIPDRNDFIKLSEEERLKYWRQTVFWEKKCDKNLTKLYTILKQQNILLCKPLCNTYLFSLMYKH